MWQPIETAPKDAGTRIIAWCVYPAGAEARVVTAYKCSCCQHVVWKCWDIIQNPTHWMPLEPPK